jgi:hypothetical protein
MKIAIMQPYFFPYIGYFQLINAVDKFVIYDDVNFIKQGWINRNYIMLNEHVQLFSLPVKDISSFRKINETQINTQDFRRIKKKILKTIQQAYSKSLNYETIFPVIENTLNIQSDFISDYAKESIFAVIDYLNINTKIIKSSEIYNNSNLNSWKRIVDICKKENSDNYINPIGGKTLYDISDFRKSTIELEFLQTQSDLSKLSIIDMLMTKTKAEIKENLYKYELK